MSDISEQGIELEPLSAIDHIEDVQPPLSPDTTTTSTASAPKPKKKSVLNVFSWHKQDKVDKSAKDAAATETAGESSQMGEATTVINKGKARATEVEDTPLVELEADVSPQNAPQPSPVIFGNFAFADPSSSAPPPTDGAAPDTDLETSLPTIGITLATRAWSFVEGEVNPYLLATPRHDKEVQEALNRRGEASKPADPRFRHHPLRILEEPGDYPHITEPRKLKHFGDLTLQTRHIHVPLATHWIDVRSIAKYAGEPLFKISKACPYILVPQTLAARLQLIIETPIILPDEVKDLAAERGLDVATLEGYDIALLHILGALWDD